MLIESLKIFMSIEIFKVFWQTLIVISDIAIKIIVTSVIIGFIILQQREKKYILVDFDCLTDIKPIEERCRIWLENHRVGSADDYFEAHISEQILIPQNILRCIKWQNMGYKLMFISSRKENLRIESAKILNDWELKGELYLTGDSYEKACKLVSISKQLGKEHKLKGLLADYTEDNRHLAQIILKTERL